MLDVFAENPLVLLFAVIGIGYLAGSASLWGFRLGIAAVLFTGIAFGALDRRCAIPDYIYILGLVLFVYSVGLQSGPSFFTSFQRRGLRFNLFACLVLVVGAVFTGVLAVVLKLSAPSAAGLFCGALTNTPALASAVETTKSLSLHLPEGAREALVASPVVSYGLAYPFGVFGVMLWIYLYTKFSRVDLRAEERALMQETNAQRILSCTFRVTNPAVIGKTVSETLRPIEDPGFVLSRIRKGERSDVVTGLTVLEADDIVVAVGDETSMQRALLLFGQQVPEQLAEGIDGISYRRVFVSNKQVVGKTVRELQIGQKMHATITRLRRGDVDIVPSPDTVLEMGDRIRVVSYKNNLEEVSHYFGDSAKAVAETDFLSLSLGIVLGAFLGMIPIPLGGGISFKLGFAGGPLIMGLILGRLGKTGPIIWEMPFNANLVLRQIGLVFFLAAIGTKAGFGFVDTVRSGGWQLLAAGAAITTLVTLLTLVVGQRYLKLPMVAAMGMLAGIGTQPAVLAYANQQTAADHPNMWYATVYPASMAAKIMLAQLIVSMMLTR